MKQQDPSAENVRKLLEMEREAIEKLAAIRAELDAQTKGERTKRVSGRPVRQVVLDTLADLDVLAYSREITWYVRARYGQEIPPTRFGSLSSDEKKAFASDRARPVHLCHGLTFDRFEPIKRTWGRDDWPLWRRIVAPTTGRVQHLEITARLCQIALDEDGGINDNLRYIAADHARALPNIRVKRGEFDLEGWRDLALSELDRKKGEDRQLREEAAARLEGHDDEFKLFGAVDTYPIKPVPAWSGGCHGEA